MSILQLVPTFFRALFKSQRRSAPENLALRRQVAMLRQSVKRPRLKPAGKLFWIIMSCYVDGWRNLLHGLHPDTVVRWHRRGFGLYWRWKSHGHKPGRLAIDTVLRKLIRDIQATNIGWGAPGIHRELLKPGIEAAQATVSKYMLRSKGRYHRPGGLFSAIMPTVSRRWISLPLQQEGFGFSMYSSC